MSTATYDTPLRVVPDLPEIKEKFAGASYLRELRGAAYTAFYKTMQLPRSIVRWGLGQLDRLVEVVGGGGVLAWFSRQASNVVGLIRQAGVVPTVVAALSAPPIAAAAVHVAKLVGRGIVSVAKTAWTGTKSLLGRCGNTGTQITESLSHTGTVIANAVKIVVGHPMMAPVVHAFRATLALVRPVSQGCVANRLLAALVPVLWLRAVIAFLFMPLLVDSTMVGNMWGWATARPAVPSSDDAEGTDDDDLDTPSADQPIPSNANLASDDVEQDAEDEEFLNRADRRAQQREDAHAKRMQHPRS